MPLQPQHCIEDSPSEFNVNVGLSVPEIRAAMNRLIKRMFEESLYPEKFFSHPTKRMSVAAAILIRTVCSPKFGEIVTCISDMGGRTTLSEHEVSLFLRNWKADEVSGTRSFWVAVPTSRSTPPSAPSAPHPARGRSPVDRRAPVPRVGAAPVPSGAAC